MTWTNNVEEYSKLNMLQDHNDKAPGVYSKHALGAECISNMVLEHYLKDY